MNDSASTGFAREQDVELHELALAVADVLVIQARVALGAALELVEEVHDELGERHLVVQLDRGRREVLHVLERARGAARQAP